MSEEMLQVYDLMPVLHVVPFVWYTKMDGCSGFLFLRIRDALDLCFLPIWLEYCGMILILEGVKLINILFNYFKGQGVNWWGGSKDNICKDCCLWHTNWTWAIYLVAESKVLLKLSFAVIVLLGVCFVFNI